LLRCNQTIDFCDKFISTWSFIPSYTNGDVLTEDHLPTTINVHSRLSAWVIAKLSGEDIYHFVARSIGSSLAGGNRGNISTQMNVAHSILRVNDGAPLPMGLVGSEIMERKLGDYIWNRCQWFSGFILCTSTCSSYHLSVRRISECRIVHKLFL